jgi:hypothetical protein
VVLCSAKNLNIRSSQKYVDKGICSAVLLRTKFGEILSILSMSVVKVYDATST